MTPWLSTYVLPVAFAVLVILIEGRRLLVGHFRRERRRRIIAGACVVTLGVPVFACSIGDMLEIKICIGKTVAWIDGPLTVVKIDYGDGRVWLADLALSRRLP